MVVKNICLFIFIVILYACQQPENSYFIVPQPNQIEHKIGKFKLSDGVQMAVPFSDEKMKNVVLQFKEQILKTSGIDIPIVDIDMHKEVHGVIFVKCDTLSDESYVVDVGKNLVKVEASSAIGTFYAIQTLYQLLPIEVYGNSLIDSVEWEMPCVRIYDSPCFSYRGVLLDVSRHFMPVPVVKQFIDLMAQSKLNRLQWHLTDDQGWRIEIKKYPKLTTIGSVRRATMVGWDEKLKDGKEHRGFYTQEEAKDIVRYAAERGITIIPEIELPGHSMAALAAYSELSCKLEQKYEVGETWGVYKQVYCPKESTFSFLEDVFTELFSIFPSEYYHIGGDECPKDSWKKCLFCQSLIKEQGLQDEYELQSYFIKRVEAFLNTNGKKVLGWDEICQGGLVPNASVTVRNGEATCCEVVSQGHQAVVTYAYLDYFQEPEETSSDLCAPGGFLFLDQVYEYEPIPVSLSAAERKYIKGVQACLWTEYIATPERLIRQAYPRIFAFSEVAWTRPKLKDTTSFYKRLPIALKRLNIQGFKEYVAK
ncbi:beta-N-acetylhexosaminidase [Parabacteroides johnsonii]|uniref:beta-N-acetylhexosaminidase n=1 Tax=Parabacteroides johnsonii TaxID=387661 RepID=UPI00266B42A5|nr:beta-N-acetylhexosaminidase [Parabacteroides johnsonii]